MANLIYTIKQLKNEFGKYNVTNIKSNDDVNIASVYVTQQIDPRNPNNIAKKLAKLGLLFSGNHKENFTEDYVTKLLKQYPNYSVCTIIELPNCFRIMIHQVNNVRVHNTIFYYICKNGICYRLNHWDK
jgi:hypothetical protein